MDNNYIELIKDFLQRNVQWSLYRSEYFIWYDFGTYRESNPFVMTGYKGHKFELYQLRFCLKTYTRSYGKLYKAGRIDLLDKERDDTILSCSYLDIAGMDSDDHKLSETDLKRLYEFMVNDYNTYKVKWWGVEPIAK